MKEKGARVINISLLDATRAKEEIVVQMAETAAKMGARRIRLADTVGTAGPEGIYFLIRKVREHLGALGDPPVIGLHCHNDFGLAAANVFAAVKAGATLIDVSVNGLESVRAIRPWLRSRRGWRFCTG